jgi:hypothetical protein
VTFAKESDVPVERSRQQIERVLERYGASHFAYGTSPGEAVVMFEASSRRVRFNLPLKPGKSLTDKQHQQFLRTRWRCLLLAITAKLESVESGISTFEEEFMAHIVLPNGKTVGQHALPYIAEAYQAKKMPPLLGFGGG